MLLHLPSVVKWTFLTFYFCLRGRTSPRIHRRRMWRSSSLDAASPLSLFDSAEWLQIWTPRRLMRRLRRPWSVLVPSLHHGMKLWTEKFPPLTFFTHFRSGPEVGSATYHAARKARFLEGLRRRSTFRCAFVCFTTRRSKRRGFLRGNKSPHARASRTPRRPPFPRFFFHLRRHIGSTLVDMWIYL